MPNTNTTKIALGESLKKLVLTKRLEKITINDLTSDCGISRMAFYYHFKDIYDLVKSVVEEKCRGSEVSAEHRAFIADFYKYGIV